jgi:tellurite methyltransferase
LSYWKDYNEAGSTQPPRPRLVNTLDRFCADRSGIALDLGSGGGRDAKELLRRGWGVVCVDSDPHAIELLSSLAATDSRLSVLRSSFEELSLPKDEFDLVTASYSLPFCGEKHFSELWRKLVESLKTGGLLSLELFGKRDSWRNAPLGANGAMTFLSREEVESLLDPFELLFFNEDERDSTTFSGELKHWHIFTCVAKKKATSQYG